MSNYSLFLLIKKIAKHRINAQNSQTNQGKKVHLPPSTYNINPEVNIIMENYRKINWSNKVCNRTPVGSIYKQCSNQNPMNKRFITTFVFSITNIYYFPILNYITFSKKVLEAFPMLKVQWIFLFLLF
ncbi:MAG: hypothetical protein US25_C0043G0009 [Candidatus Moranbacteria bacterium GW2011_GWE1_36_7]|nr:MAG: hypothetical protein US25_C0043G0009 [Candidatus Moranbacteria bacterium GW2011_GWE1_36_7]